MKASQEYIENLKRKIITSEMLSDCLYSVNKRAKNCRNHARFLANSYSLEGERKYNKYIEEMNEYYAKKHKLLSLLKPKCIHHEIYYHNKVKRYYDTDRSFNKQFERAIENDKLLRTGAFYDISIDCYKRYIDIVTSVEEEHKYYLYYELLDHSYHHPIDKSEITNYKNLNVINLEDNILTEGKNVNELIDMDFVDQVIELLDKTYTLLEDM